MGSSFGAIQLRMINTNRFSLQTTDNEAIETGVNYFDFEQPLSLLLNCEGEARVTGDNSISRFVPQHRK